MLGIGRKIKKIYLKKIFNLINKYTPKKFYSLILFLSSFKKFKKEINKSKTSYLYSKNLDKINYKEYKITSQNNEDGIIEYIFSNISNNKFFIEIGFDYFECNTLNLIKRGWNGILIEADEEKCLRIEKCIKHFFPNNKIEIINSKIDRDNINNFTKHQKIDFFSIDIDGNDYWVLEKLEKENISIICSEYNPWIGNKNFKTIPYDKNFIYKNDYYFGASLNAYSDLLKKNPKIVCVVGLHTEPERLADIRKNRMNSLKESGNKFYTDLEKIKNEVNNAKNTFKKYEWPIIDVTRKSVEETAASIIKIYEIYKQNG